MALDVKPGAKVRVKVTKNPTNQAAAKTLSRLFLKDPAASKARRQRKQLVKNARYGERRGGRIWIVRPQAPRLYQPKAGDQCTMLATVSTIRDLQSVSRFVEVS